MLMPGRKYEAGSSYRYGFNGKENDNEVKDEGNQQDYGMRIYDPRLGRFLSVDPLTREYAFYTPYQFAGNKPIMAVDLDGLEEKPAITGTDEGQTTQTTEHNHNSAGDEVGGKTTTWYYHKGGAQIGQTQDKKGNIAPVLSKSGWYTEDDYVKLLSQTYAAEELAYSYSKFAIPRNISGSTNELIKFAGQGLSSTAQNLLITAAYNLANKAQAKAAGLIEPSSFNVEDIIGVGLIFKEGVKMLGTYTAKYILSKVTLQSVPKDIFVKVGWWSTIENYNLMKSTGKVVEEQGGFTFFSIAGPNGWPSAPKGWIYSEFEVPANSLIGAGKWDWFRAVHSTAGKTWQNMISKQGGTLAPSIRNLSPILQTK